MNHYFIVIHGPKSASSGHGAALMIASWWHSWQLTASE
jgi:hypothetical protein